MASRTVLLDIKDLRGGRNGVDSPLELQPDQCVEAINVDWYQGLLGRKRKGAELVLLTGTTFQFRLSSLIRHIVSTETDNELWAIDGVGYTGRLVNGTWAWVGKLPASTTVCITVGASFNDKLFLAYPNTDGRLHVWDGTSVRKVGLTGPAAAPIITAAAGTGLTGPRWYRIAWATYVGTVVARRSLLSPAGTLTLTNQGGYIVARPTLPGEGETHWEVYAGSTVNGPWYLAAAFPAATVSWTDVNQPTPWPPANWPGTLAPLDGAYTSPPSAKYLLVDEARLLMGSDWRASGGYTSRVYWTPILYDSSGVANDERLNWTVSNAPFIDFDPGDGGDLTGMGGPLFDSPYVFKFDRIYKMVRTGLAGAPYRPVTVSKKCGAIRHQTIVLGEDESGAECLYFLSRRGPYRIGVNGLQYCGRDIEDLWARVNLAGATHINYGAHGIYVADLHQVWWWVNTTAIVPDPPNYKLVFDVKQGRFTQIEGVRRGWSQHTGRSSVALSSVMYSAVPGNPNSLELKPYIGSGEPPQPGSLWRLETGSTDIGTPYESLIRTRVELPGGSVAIHGGVIEGHLVAWPPNGAVIPLRVTTIRDFGLERRDSTALLADTTPTTIRLVTPIRDLGAASVAALQVEITDQSVAQPWTLDALVLRVRREEDR